MSAGIYSFFRRFRSRRGLETPREPVPGRLPGSGPLGSPAFVPPSQAISAQEITRLEQDYPRLQKLMRLRAEEVARMNVQELHQCLDYEIEKLKRLHPQAVNVLEIARLLAIDKTGEPSQADHEAIVPKGQANEDISQALTEEKPYLERPGDKIFLGEKDTALTIVDRPVGAGITADTGLLQAVNTVMRICTVPTEAILEDRPSSGLLFAYSIAELAYMFSIEGAQVLTLDDRQERVFGVYIYFTAGAQNIPEEDQVMVEPALCYLGANRPEIKKVGVAETVCIDSAVEDIADDSGQKHRRGEYYRQMLFEGDSDAQFQGCDIWVGWCREKPAANLAIKAHSRNGWEDIGKLELISTHFGFPSAYRILKRELFAGEPGVRIVPFEDRDPSDGHTGIIPRGTSLRIRRLV